MNTTESESREIVTTPLDLPAGTDAETRLEAVRDLMMNGFAPIIEAGLANLPLAQQQEAFLVEAAHFTVFFLAIRLTDIRQQKPELKNTMQSFRVLHRKMEAECVARFAELSRAYKDGELA